MEKWGLFTVKDDVKETIETIGNRGLIIEEVRKLTAMEKLTYGFLITAPLWIIVFKASKDEYESLVKSNELTKVF